MSQALSYFGSRQDRLARKVKKRGQAILFETLEPRILLSADALPLSVDLETEGVNNIVVRRDVDTLNIVNTATGSVIASQALAKTSNIAIRGSSLNDYIAIIIRRLIPWKVSAALCRISRTMFRSSRPGRLPV